MLDKEHPRPSADDPALRESDAVNPYIVGGRQILNRLRWDLKPESWRSRAALKKLKDSHRGEKAVILCNGPSLNRVDLAKLAGVYCFGLNKINLLFPRSDFRPSCIVATDRFTLQQNAPFFNATDIPLFLASYATQHVSAGPRRIFVPITVTRMRFARDCSMSVCSGHMVTFVALQLAYHMGFTAVALVGADHSYKTEGPNLVVETGPIEPDHFDPHYFSSGMQRVLPDLLGQSLAYRLAYNTFGAAGRQLVNATDGGHLELLPRVPLDEFLAH